VTGQQFSQGGTLLPCDDEILAEESLGSILRATDSRQWAMDVGLVTAGRAADARDARIRNPGIETAKFHRENSLGADNSPDFRRLIYTLHDYRNKALFYSSLFAFALSQGGNL
jgi:hypothetical protein